MNLKLCLTLCILSIGIITSCNSRKKNNTNCEEHFERAREFVNDYYSDETPESLDSAMVYLVAVEENCNYEQAVIDINKANIYFLKNDFKKAISIFEGYDQYSFSYPRDGLINKIKAVEARTNGDERLEKEYYSLIINDLEDYVASYREIRDSMLRSDDNYWSMGNDFISINVFFGEIYYYKYKLYGKEETFRELDSLQQALNGNEYYFDNLKELLEKDGYSTVFD